jgi:Raf kinase inhibitor-like YbhB/YbcL family protein
MKKVYVILGLLALLFVGVVCAENKESAKNDNEAKPEVNMIITGQTFENGEFIPTKFSCEGADISPALDIVDVPKEAKSLALICDDPDAPVGLWVHWVTYNIPPDIEVLPEGISKTEQATFGEDPPYTITQGINSWGKFGYGGPCPPPGKPHRYFFKLYALDTMLEFDEETAPKGVNNQVLLKQMDGHILAEASVMGKYKR